MAWGRREVWQQWGGAGAAGRVGEFGCVVAELVG